ncbi:MAG: GNAT family N-acetyltransferase [Chlorobiales bacterium]|nr:GNAT family N-acetyltransferase [Chlorobiales bacterium]
MIGMVQYKTGTDPIDWEALGDLYEEIGLVAQFGKKRDLEKIRQAFQSSYKVVTAWKKGKLVGAGRLLSDGLCYGTIYDVGVFQACRKQGIGKGIMEALLRGNEHLLVYLTSTFGNEGFYSKLGFKKHKTAYAKYPRESEYLEQ